MPELAIDDNESSLNAIFETETVSAMIVCLSAFEIHDLNLNLMRFDNNDYFIRLLLLADLHRQLNERDTLFSHLNVPLI